MEGISPDIYLFKSILKEATMALGSTVVLGFPLFKAGPMFVVAACTITMYGYSEGTCC